MSKHTPGPWSIYFKSGGLVPRIIVGAGGGSIADANAGFPCSVEEQDANARLIAAAPDLLAACKALLPYVEDQVERGQIPGEDTSHYGDARAVGAANAAIAKAEGGGK